MSIFPHAVKQPLLVMELKKKRKEEEEDRKFKQLSNKQEACSLGLKIIFIAVHRKVSTGRQLQSSQTWTLMLIKFYWLTYKNKIKDKTSNT